MNPKQNKSTSEYKLNKLNKLIPPQSPLYSPYHFSLLHPLLPRPLKHLHHLHFQCCTIMPHSHTYLPKLLPNLPLVPHNTNPPPPPVPHLPPPIHVLFVPSYQLPSILRKGEYGTEECGAVFVGAEGVKCGAFDVCCMFVL